MRVRQAFAQAVDWRRLAALDEPGSSVPATGMVPAGMPGTPEGDFLPPYDPAGAQALLAEAGYPDGASLGPISFIANGGGYDGAIVAMLEENLGVDDRVRDDGLRDLPGAAGDGSAGALEPLVGRGLPGSQRLPGRPARDGLHGQPGRLVVDAASTPRSREATAAARPRRRRRPPTPRRWPIVRDEVPAVPVPTGPRSRWSATGCWAPARPGPGSCGWRASPGRRGSERDARAPRAWPRCSRRRSCVAGPLLPAVARRRAPRTSPSARPEAEVAYGEGIDFTVADDGPVPLARVEIRLGYPGEPRAVHRGGARRQPARHETLRYRLDLTGGGHLVPNTTIEATWAAYPAAAASRSCPRAETVRYADTDQDWRTLEGDLVDRALVRGQRGVRAQGAADRRQAVRETADLLGVTETEPIDFFIYGDEAAFRDGAGARDAGERRRPGARGHPDAVRADRARRRSTTPGSASWSRTSSTHLVFDTAVSNPYRFPPRWLNEGLAVYLSEGYAPADRNLRRGGRRRAGTCCRSPRSPASSRPTRTRRTSPTPRRSPRSTTSSGRTARTRCSRWSTRTGTGLTDDEAFTKATRARTSPAFQAGWLAELGADDPERTVRSPTRPARCRPAGAGPRRRRPGPHAAAPRAAPPGAPGATGGAEDPAWRAASPPAPAPSRARRGGVGVVVVVIVGLVVARRRTAVP